MKARDFGRACAPNLWSQASSNLNRLIAEFALVAGQVGEGAQVKSTGFGRVRASERLSWDEADSE